jgi:hypothetical protein
MLLTGRFLRVLLVFAIAAFGLAGAARHADAQERVERKSILQLLFGTPKREVREQEPEPKRLKPRTSNRTKKQTTTDTAKAAPVAVEKLPDARTVLVIGDFVAGGLGEGLTAAFEATPGIVITSRTNGSSGIVRDDYYDWPGNLPEVIAETKPAIVIVNIGANDRQQMSVGSAKEKFRSEGWLKEYEARVARIAAIAGGEGRTFLWVGMPAFQSSAMTADMTTLNNMYRAGAEKAGGDFIDIWDGFVDENGKFVTTGSDINGQQVRLRGSDGINFTKAGKRKLAFYIEKEIRRMLGDVAVDGLALQGSGSLRDILVTAPAADAEIVKTQPISLTDPALDGGTVLLGGSVESKGAGTSVREKLIEKGEVADGPIGRVDDFRLNKAVVK